jgi:hypothetical protein
VVVRSSQFYSNSIEQQNKPIEASLQRHNMFCALRVLLCGHDTIGNRKPQNITNGPLSLHSSIFNSTYQNHD